MRELECKLYIENGSIGDIVKVLAAGGIHFSQAQSQVDFVYATSPNVVIKPVPGSVVARVRIEANSRITLTVKIRRETELDRSEFEVEVGDSAAARDVLTALGLRDIVTVSKRRRTATLGTDTSITVDDVDGLGVFMEVEVLDDERVAASRRLEEIMATIRSMLGDEGVTVDKGYDRLLLERGVAS